MGGCRCLLVGLRRRLGVLEDAVEGIAAIAGGEDESGPVLGEKPFGFKALADKAAEVSVHCESSSTSFQGLELKDAIAL